MNHERFQSLSARYHQLRIAVVGDICLDRYLEIDPDKEEISLETGLPVYNVTNVRSQPGGAGTILNNLIALEIGEIFPVGFCGEDGEGFELRRALQANPRVRLDFFFQTPERRTFTYTKPLLLRPGTGPRELNRLDMKNWTPTPPVASERLEQAVMDLMARVDAMILLDQVDICDTGVVNRRVLSAIEKAAEANPGQLILADSRRSLRGFPKVHFKMNQAELARLMDATASGDLIEVQRQALALAREQGKPVFVTLAERGIVGAAPSGEVCHSPALPVRGEIDVVGAGDAVTANLTAALAAGAALEEAVEIAMAAASIVIHQLGTTGTAAAAEIGQVVAGS